MGLAKPGRNHLLTVLGTCLDHHETSGLVFGQVWDQTELILTSEHRPLAGYPDLLLTLLICNHSC